MSAYNKVICLARKDYFSKIITKDAGNSIILFSTVDQPLNTASDPPQFSPSKCEELALSFNNKITSIRDSIAADVNTDDLSKSCKNDVTMGKFTCITLTELCKTVTECNSSTSCIDPVPTAF